MPIAGAPATVTGVGVFAAVNVPVVHELLDGLVVGVVGVVGFVLLPLPQAAIRSTAPTQTNKIGFKEFSRPNEMLRALNVVVLCTLRRVQIPDR
jgi:hypothetical protein